MSVDSFLNFLTSDERIKSSTTCLKTVNLLKLSKQTTIVQRSVGGGQSRSSCDPDRPRTALVLDGESCLDRLYGGYFSDWASGGQWANMLDFLTVLLSTLQEANVQLAIFLNGGLQPQRFAEWKSRQLAVSKNVAQVMKHVLKKGTPPPKAWWVPPASVHMMLRIALKSLNCLVIQSLEDHLQEVMSFCWENGYHGVMADGSEYALVNAPRLFSAKSLKMSFQFDVTTTEINMDEVAKCLDVNPNRFGLVAALLGNHILSAEELNEFHAKLVPEIGRNQGETGFSNVIRAVVNYIRTLPKVDDFERMGKDVFGSSTDPRVKKLKASLQYYDHCSQEGYLRRPKPKANGKKRKPQVGSIKIPEEDKKYLQTATNRTKEASSDTHENFDFVEQIALDFEQLDLSEAMSAASFENKNSQNDSSIPGEEMETNTKSNLNNAEGNGDVSVVQALASGVSVRPSEEGKYPKKNESTCIQSTATNIPPKPSVLPDIHPDVYKIALERHRLSQMSPLVYQTLTRGEITLPVLMEESKARDGIPPIHLLFRPLRQSVYAVLFNLNHQKFNRKQAEEKAKNDRKKAEQMMKQVKSMESDEEKASLASKAEKLMNSAAHIKDIAPLQFTVREWVPYNSYSFPETVEAIDISWSVPTVQRLWFGTSIEDNQRRLRAFLSCLSSDECPPLLMHSNVPQHMILLACVVRYIMMRSSTMIFRKHEVDALLVTAFSPELRNPKLIGGMKLGVLTKRGIQLATMIMQGIEMAIFANDACGGTLKIANLFALFLDFIVPAPIPFHMCLPWTFFDGKLFQAKLMQADRSRSLVELCEGRMEIVYAVERMRNAITFGIIGPTRPRNMPSFPPNGAPFPRHSGFLGGFGGDLHPSNRFGPTQKSGQLKVGGSVVGLWGAQKKSGGSKRNQHQKKKKSKKTEQEQTNNSDNDDDGNFTIATRNKETNRDTSGKQVQEESSKDQQCGNDLIAVSAN